MEAVAAHTEVGAPLCGDGVGGRSWGQRGVEGGVEAGHRRDVGQDVEGGVQCGQCWWLVQWGQCDQLLQLR